MSEEDKIDSFLQSRIQSCSPMENVCRLIEQQQAEIQRNHNAAPTYYEHIQLHDPPKITVIAPRKPIILHSEHQRGYSANQTMKKGSTVSESSPAHQQNEKTKGEIRMKIILENKRLKNSIEQFRKDLDYYRSNETQIASILRESKAKLADYRERMKQKTKKITKLTEDNIYLKKERESFQQKLNHLTAYSEWQQNQISELKKQVIERCREVEDSQVLRAKIDKLQQLLKQYDSELSKVEEKKSSQSSIRLANLNIESGQPINGQEVTLSAQTLSQANQSPERWISMKQMDIGELDAIKSKRVSEEQYQHLAEVSSGLRSKILDLEHELEQMQQRDIAKQEERKQMEKEMQLQQLHHNEEIGIINNKVISLEKELGKKEEEIKQLKMQLQANSDQLEASTHHDRNDNQKLKQQIQQLSAELQRKDETLHELNQKIRDTQAHLRKIIRDIQKEYQQENDKLLADIEGAYNHNKQISAKLSNQEKRSQELQAKVDQFQINREENQEKIKQALTAISNKKQLEQLIQKLEEQNQYYQQQVKNQEKANDSDNFFQQKLYQAESFIKLLQQQKKAHAEDMERYARQIRQLKVEISEMSRQKGQSLNSIQKQRVIQQQQEEEEPSVVNSEEEEQAQSDRIQKEGELVAPNSDMSECGHRHEENMHIIRANPLKEEAELKEESLDNQEEIEKLNDKHLYNSQRENFLKITARQNHLQDEVEAVRQKFRQELDEEMDKHNIQVIDLNFKIEKEKEERNQIQSRVKQLQQQLQQISQHYKLKADEVQIKQNQMMEKQFKHRQERSALMAAKEQLQDVVRNKEIELSNQTDKISQLLKQINQLRQEISEMSNKLSKAESTSQKVIHEKDMLLQKKIDLEIAVQKLQHEQELLCSSKQQLINQQIQLKSSLELHLSKQKAIEDALQSSRRLTESVKEEEKLLVNKLNKQIEGWNNRCSQLQEQLKIYSMQKNKLREEIISLITEKDKVNDRNNILQKQARKLEAEKHRIMELMNNQTNQIQEDNITKSKLETEVLRLGESSTKWQTRYEQQFKQKKILLSKLLQSQQKLQYLSDQNFKSKRQIQQKLGVLENIISEQKNHIEKQYIEKQSLINTNKEYNHSLTELEETKRSLEDNNQLLARRIAEVATLNATVNQEIGKFHDRISELQQQNEHLIQKSDKQEKELKKIKQENQWLQKQNQRIKERSDERQKGLKFLKSSLANLKGSLELSNTSSLGKQNQESLEIKIEDEGDLQIDQIRNQIHHLQIKHRNSMEEYQSKIKQLQEKYHSSQNQLTHSQDSNSQLAKRLRGSEERVRDYEEKLRSLESAVRECQQRLMEKEQQNKHQGQELNQQLAQSNKIKGQIEQLQARLKQSMNKAAQTESQLNKAKDSNLLKENTIQSYQERLQLGQLELQTKCNQILGLSDQITTQSVKIDTFILKINQLESALHLKDQGIIELNITHQKEQIAFKDDLKVTKHLMQQLQQEYDLKINKLNKEVSRLKLVLEETKKQNSFKMDQLEQSNRSIGEVKNQLKRKDEQIKQKDEQIKQLKENAMNFREQFQKAKIGLNRYQEQINVLNQQIQEEQTTLKAFTQQIQTLKLHIASAKNISQSQIQEKHKIQNNIAQLQTNYQQLKQEKIQLEMENTKITEIMTHVQKQKNILAQQTEQLAEAKTKLQNFEKKQRQQLINLSVQKNQLMSKFKKIQQEKDTILHQSVLNQQKLKQCIKSQQTYLNKLKQQKHNIQRDLEAQKSRTRNIQKQHQSQIQSMCLQQREKMSDLQKKHIKETDAVKEQKNKAIKQSTNQVQKLKKMMELQAESEQQLKQQLQTLRERYKQDQKQLKLSENERGELTDKMIQLTQENNQLNQVMEALRNDVIAKSNQIFQCRQLIQKLQQQNQDLKQKVSPHDSTNSIPLSIETDQKLIKAQEYIEKLLQINRQMKIKEEVLLGQLRQKSKQLQDKLETGAKSRQVKQNRDRGSSGDSWVSRSKIFNDEKSQTLHAELQQTKLKLESAEAYIVQLQDQCQKLALNQSGDPMNTMSINDKKLQQKQKQIQDLKMKIEYLDAYVEQLQSFNMKSSVRSKSVYSKRDHQQNSMRGGREQDSSRRQSVIKEKGERDMKLEQKIGLLISFIQNYSREVSSSSQQQQQIKQHLKEPCLQELLSTIFYRLQKQTIIYRERQHVISQLHEEQQHLQEEVRKNKDDCNFLIKKIAYLENYQKKYEETQKMMQEALITQMKMQADLAQNKTYVQQLQTRLVKAGQSIDKIKQNKEQSDKGLTKRQKQTLQILQEQNQSQSDSMMSESADSQMPSSVSQSKQFKSSVDIRSKNVQKGQSNLLTMSKGLTRAKSLNTQEQKLQSIQFLKKCLLRIDQLERNSEHIQKQLEEKQKILGTGKKNDQNDRLTLIKKLQEIQSKMNQGEKQMKYHYQKSQLELASLIKDLLKYRQEQDQYGLHNDSRKKIEEYLGLLESELLKNSRLYEEQGKNQKKGQLNSSRLKNNSLHQIKEDVLNEDKGSSIVNPRGTAVLQSFSNSQGVTESFDANQLRNGYNEVIRELHQTHDELMNKDQQLKIVQHRYGIIEQQVSTVLDEIRIYFQENQYLFQQIQKIKKFMNKFYQDTSAIKIGDSARKIIQEEKNNQTILLESNQKRKDGKQTDFGVNKETNYLQTLLQMEQKQFYSLGSALSNEHLKQLQRRIEQILQDRFNECFQQLQGQKSLIADILNVNQNQNLLYQYMNKLASKLTKQQIADIINNSPNRLQAYRTLSHILKQKNQKSQVSDQHNFTPNSDKLQQIRNKIYDKPTEFSLALHNKLIEILGSPSQQDFYDNAQQFYTLILNYQQKTRLQLQKQQQQSQKHSIRMHELLQDPLQGIDFAKLQKYDRLELKNQKNRSNSCTLNITENGKE